MPGPEAIVLKPGVSRTMMLAAGRAFLREAQIEAAEEDARLLLLAACSIDRLALVTGADDPATADQTRLYRAFLDRRAAGEPTSRIIGRRPFWTLDLEVRPGVLDPRADTEAVVRLALRTAERKGEAPRRILDLGCGSGAILCALLTEFEYAAGLGVDLSAEACVATRANLAMASVGDRATVVQGRWCEGIDEIFDLVVSNPPYIRADEIAGLDREVRNHDPRLALDGGPDGLDAYREIFAAAPRILASDGTLVVEFGLGQGGDVERLAAVAGLKKTDGERDLAGADRAAAFVVA